MVDQDGRTYSGVIAAETATSLTLRRGDGAEDTILRAQVAEMAGTGLSMMPEGFEKTIAKPEMADLIAFLRASHRGGEGQGPDADDRSRPLDIGTLAGPDRAGGTRADLAPFHHDARPEPGDQHTIDA